MSPSEDDRFRQVKLHFGTMDDLGQERRKAWTEWVTGRMETTAFAELMRGNLQRTREAAEELEKLL